MILINEPMPRSCIHCKAWTSSFYHNCIYTGSRFAYQDAVLKRQDDCPIISFETDDPAERRMLEEAGFEL